MHYLKEGGSFRDMVGRVNKLGKVSKRGHILFWGPDFDTLTNLSTRRTLTPPGSGFDTLTDLLTRPTLAPEDIFPRPTKIYAFLGT